MEKIKNLNLYKGVFAFILLNSISSLAFSQSSNNSPQLLELNASAPNGTKAVRYYIDNVRVSELTDLYATQTNTKPVWKTVIDPQWFEAGVHELRIEADTHQGNVILEKRKISVDKKNSPKNRISLTGAWDFAEMGKNAEGEKPNAVQPGFKEGNWTSVMVPNSLGYLDKKWNTKNGLIGVYRRNLEINEIAKDEQFAIVLEACYWSARVFVNGVEVGQTKGGYLPSRFDITKAVTKGKNDIAVITDNRLSKMGVFKRLNEFYWNWGGLVQEVYVERNPSVALIEMRAEGTESGKLNLSLSGINATSTVQKNKFTVEVYDPSNKKVIAKSLTVEIPVNGGNIKPIELQINKPILWNLENPNLYTVVIKGDWGTLKERTGFRDVKVVGSEITINGKVMENLQGFNRHADYPGLGRTQPDGLVYKELKELYNKGFRLLRPGHYSTTPALLDAADQLGMLVIEEINVTGLTGEQLSSKEVKEFGAQQLTKMILRDRSHPSVIAWSVGNENLTEEDAAIEYIKETIQLGRSLDPKRLYTHVTMRHTKDKTYQYQDFVAQNFYAGWYAKDVDSIARLMDAIQTYSGNKPVMLSEYGAEAVIGRPGTEKSTEFYQGYVVDAHNRLLNKRKHFFGKMYWTSTEFWCRPDWAGGSPAPIPPFHVKAIGGYYRDYKKLAWRVMFSPIRLTFNDAAIKKTDFGGELEASADKSVINQTITINELHGKATSGKLLITPPMGFTAEATEIPFQVGPNESVSVTFVLKGQIPVLYTAVKGYFKAVINEDTEAQPLELTVRLAGEQVTSSK